QARPAAFATAASMSAIAVPLIVPCSAGVRRKGYAPDSLRNGGSEGLPGACGGVWVLPRAYIVASLNAVMGRGNIGYMRRRQVGQRHVQFRETVTQFSQAYIAMITSLVAREHSPGQKCCTGVQ